MPHLDPTRSETPCKQKVSAIRGLRESALMAVQGTVGGPEESFHPGRCVRTGLRRLAVTVEVPISHPPPSPLTWVMPLRQVVAGWNGMWRHPL